ncbi:hypothetical protein OESDEN_09560 [Oesophagostomum dentatum]|uniref:Uncharacterized protein n=1 Tax=Oesophagostomum dentatum TaxID=61180 RepID=A0A0B1T032_OESDE|nr:hypothetical protein OESDEN_09560 [Oesophagostomum dentatum]
MSIFDRIACHIDLACAPGSIGSGDNYGVLNFMFPMYTDRFGAENLVRNALSMAAGGSYDPSSVFVYSSIMNGYVTVTVNAYNINCRYKDYFVGRILQYVRGYTAYTANCYP